MPLEWIEVLRGPVSAALKKVGSSAVEWAKRRRAASRALEGDDLLSEDGLQQLIQKHLDDLATAAEHRLPPAIQPAAFRHWLRTQSNVPLFEEAFVAHAGNLPELAQRAESKLLDDYDRITHGASQANKARVQLAINYVYGQLRASSIGRELLQLALERWMAARLYEVQQAEEADFPTGEDLERVRSMANALLESGRRSWKMPSFVAPLTLEAHERSADEKTRPTNAIELAASIQRGESAVLYGEGGIGKTTFLLDLGATCLRGNGRIPLFIDAAAWGRTSEGLLDYLTARPAAHAHRVTSAELSRLAAGGQLVLVLNGWNEITASSKLACQDELTQLLAATERLNVIVASRTRADAPSLIDAKRIEVRGLTWPGQSAVVRAELTDNRAAPLLDLLTIDTRLRHAARSPLILRGLITQAIRGDALSATTFDLLGAAVRTFEEDEQRRDRLNIAPVDGHQRAYLEEIACALTGRLTTRCSREDALRMVHTAATQLQREGLLGAIPSPAAILDVLVSFHLLHIEDGSLRFAHQRFQEYFAANRLLGECMDERASTLLPVAVNQPAWEDALVLAAGALVGETGAGRPRARLIKMAAAVDLGVACDLASISGFERSDDGDLRDDLITRINELAGSRLREAHELGLIYQITSGFPEFADALWPLLESDSQQTRLNTYRLAGRAISLGQLGTGAAQRVGSWPAARRAEFVHEIADSPENYDFLVRLAEEEPNTEVRAAAISALFWHFPASEAPMQAWLAAPSEVQTDRDVLSHLRYALEEGHIEEPIKQRLLSLAPGDASDAAQIQLALASPNDVPVEAIEAVFRALRKETFPAEQIALVNIARHHAPDRLLTLAREIALTFQRKPEWTREYLHAASTEVRRALFEEGWNALHSQSHKALSADYFGPLADREQIDRCIAACLAYEASTSADRTEADRDINRQHQSILAHASGDDLLRSVLARAEASSYAEAATLLGLVSQRLGRDDGSNTSASKWLPSVADGHALITAFSGKMETTDVPQETVRVYLSRILSRAAPAEFGPFILDTCRRYLDAWSIFHEQLRQWIQHRRGPRPMNPHGGHTLSLALTRLAPDALPGLLDLMDHPSAMDFLPEAIAAVASLHWSTQGNRMFSSISADIRDGVERRRQEKQLRQPNDSIQLWTDRAAERLSQKLLEVVNSYEQGPSALGANVAREAQHRIGRLTGILAQLRSELIRAPVNRALASGLMDLHGTISALRSLVRQGQLITDAAVVAQFEAVYERSVSAKWHDDSTRYALSEATALLLCAVPEALRAKQLKHYVDLWRRFSHRSEIVRTLGDTRLEAAWPILLVVANTADNTKGVPEELVYALVSVLSPQLLPSFFALIADGRLFAWCESAWTLKRLAPDIAMVLNNASEQVPSFIAACGDQRAPLADTLAVEVLSRIDGNEGRCMDILLEALDAGRAATSHTRAFEMLEGMFTSHTALGDSQYEVKAKSTNVLRSQLYARAKGAGAGSEASRRLLASVECTRREGDRPLDEPRHPAVEDGLSWTDALLSH